MNVFVCVCMCGRLLPLHGIGIEVAETLDYHITGYFYQTPWKVGFFLTPTYNRHPSGLSREQQIIN